MSGVTRRPSISSSSSSSSKRPASENAGKVLAAPSQQAKKKRAPLGNLTNQCIAGRNPGQSSVGKGTNKAAAGITAFIVKKGSATQIRDKVLNQNSEVVSSIARPSITIACKDTSTSIVDAAPTSVFYPLAPCSSGLSPTQSDGGSVSFDETMSTCDSMKSPDFEYIDNADSSVVASLERRATDNLHISEGTDEAGYTRKEPFLSAVGTTDDVIDVDNNHKDTQMCTTLACDIYDHLRLAETKKRPSTDFMEGIQKDINASMRAILVDWLVEVAEEYRLVPDTLYLTVNYIDRYLSSNEMNRQRLQLLGVACMLIAAKYEEICAPQVEEFCYITDNTYFKDEVLQMEAAVLKHLKFEMTAPTAKCFLRRFVRAAQRSDEVPLLQLEFMANYLAELSLLEYSMLCHYPSLIAASAIFLAKFILVPTKRPWNATLDHYTSYKPSQLCECVKALHRLFCNSPNNNLPAIREKYSQHKYKFVAKKFCPSLIPSEFFQDI